MTPEKAANLLELTARVEAADPSLPNLDLHEEILLALGWTQRGAKLIDPQGQRCMQTPDPLHSMDGATALVPDSCLHMARTIWDAGGKTAGLARIDRYEGAGDAMMWADGFDACAATPALALCAAALRARAGDGA